MPYKDLSVRKEYAKSYYHTYDRVNKIKNYNRRRPQYLKLKNEIFNAYGGPICSCCGEKRIEILTVSHIESGCRQQLEKIGKGNSFFIWLKKNEYPKGYRVRCFNCSSTNGVEKSKRPKSENKTTIWCRKQRERVFELLGYTCSVCGDKRIPSLHIDHIDGGGYQHKKICGGNHGVYRYILKMENPKEHFRVLCANCNWIARLERMKNVPVPIHS